jgi:pimeloyl-ACP methyl ester carboxylesterase
MDLFHRDLGGRGTPIVILHGLFGSSRNWVAAGRALTRYGRVLALDLRNHGESGHAATHSLFDLMGDLEEWTARHLDREPVLLGHSMGGLAAMGYALTRPERARALIVVDVAPRGYAEGHEPELAALRLDISRFASRGEIDRAMEPLLPDPQKRQFLQMNAERSGGGFRWRINRAALERATFSTDFSRVAGEYRGDALFLIGGQSDYVREEDHTLIRRFFPAARLEVIARGGHWLHNDAPAELQQAVGRFLEELGRGTSHGGGR